jgi:hypothetical protein
MKKLLQYLSLSIVSLVTFSGIASAATVNPEVNNAYYKTNNAYDVVLKDKAGDKLGLYVNDKNPVYATANKQGWVTFKKVSMGSSGKLSFTHVYGNTKHQKPINYVRYFNTDNNKVTFSAQPDTMAPASPAPVIQTAPQPTPVPLSTQENTPPTPSCTNGSYVNSSGNTVCSPESSTSAPVGATAHCVDGTYSFSQHHSGTCSRHGGVSVWL